MREFAFFNQQLAAMVRDGIPLEGALQRLCAEMRRGELRTELMKLGDDLAKGIPLREAVQARQLPDFYRQMLEIGGQTNDFPAVLTLLADHYQKRQLLWTRLKGLMVYPTIVLCAALLLSCFLSVLLNVVYKSVRRIASAEFFGKSRDAAPYVIRHLVSARSIGVGNRCMFGRGVSSGSPSRLALAIAGV